MRLSEIRRSGKQLIEGMTLADRLLLIALIIIIASGFALIKKAFPKGADVNIAVNGKPAYKLPLNNDATVTVKGIMGNTIVEIKDKKVCIKESPCPNKTCMHNGWIDKGAIVCLPNRVTVFIGPHAGSGLNRENNQDKTLDAITG